MDKYKLMKEVKKGKGKEAGSVGRKKEESGKVGKERNDERVE